jgi:hypothetical protein
MDANPSIRVQLSGGKKFAASIGRLFTAVKRVTGRFAPARGKDFFGRNNSNDEFLSPKSMFSKLNTTVDSPGSIRYAVK